MFNEKFLREQIKEQIDKGNRDFIIFPYGTNGMNVKRCLEECFSIEPVMIIDKEYSKYSPKIMDFEYLRLNYKENMTVFLTIENTLINAELYRQLVSFISREQIVNLIHSSSFSKVDEKAISNEEDEFEKFSLDYFIPNFRQKPVYHNSDNQKIRVRFYHSEYIYWNSIKSIYHAFRMDDKYDLCIILKSHDELEKNQMKREKCSYVMLSEYDVKKDMPDVLILSNLWDDTYIANCRKYTKLIIAVPLSIIRYTYSLDGFWSRIRKGFGYYHPDYFLFDSLLYNEIKESKYNSKKIIEMGNAKFDGIYIESAKEKVFPEQWEKLKGKKVIFWTIDHGIKDGRIAAHVTFNLYAKAIFEYALNHPDIGIIMRFHRGFMYEMLENHCWSREDVDILHDYCNKTSNIVWDESDSYDLAYSLADAILTEVLCGIICSALPTLKPVCVLYKDKQIKSAHPELTDCYYSAYSEQDLISFFDMVKENDDPMYDLRVEASQKYIKHFDGKNGERIKAFIEEKYFEQRD